MDHNFFCGLWKFSDQKLYSDQNFFRPKTYFLYQNFFCSNETSIKSCLAWIFCQNKSNTLSWHLTANQCLEFFKVLNAMFRIVLILSADKDDIHFLRHLLKYLHKQHPFKSIGFDIKAIQSCKLTLVKLDLKMQQQYQTRLNCFNVKTTWFELMLFM